MYINKDNLGKNMDQKVNQISNKIQEFEIILYGVL